MSCQLHSDRLLHPRLPTASRASRCREFSKHFRELPAATPVLISSTMRRAKLLSRHFLEVRRACSPPWPALRTRPACARAACWGVVEKQFLSNSAWVDKLLKPGAKTDMKVRAVGWGGLACARSHVLFARARRATSSRGSTSPRPSTSCICSSCCPPGRPSTTTCACSWSTTRMLRARSRALTPRVLKGVHYTHGRFLPFEWVLAVLQANKAGCDRP